MKLWREKEEAWKEIRPGVYNGVLYEEGFGSVSMVRFRKGSHYPLHKDGVDHLGILIKGKGIFDIGTKKLSFTEGDSYLIKPDNDHGFTNTSEEDSIMLEIFVPPRDGSSKVGQKSETP